VRGAGTNEPELDGATGRRLSLRVQSELALKANLSF
jgi:hypothetical protein